MTKIVLIGAGSASFGFGTLCDLFAAREELVGATVALVDTDARALERASQVAARLNEEAGHPFRFVSSTERREVLAGADFIVIAIAVRRNETWRLDFEIPLKHGVRQVLGENGGPGGLFHAMRNIPPLLAICMDVEQLCPDALVLSFSNPEARLCLAASRYSNTRFVGLCHGIGMAQTVIAEALGMEADEIDPLAAGLNHFTWVLAMRRASTGEDLYPQFRAAMEEVDTSEAGAASYRWNIRLCRFLMDTFGLWPSPSDDHVGEYLAYAWEFCGLDGYDFKGAELRQAATESLLTRIAKGDQPGSAYLRSTYGERAVPIIVGVVRNAHNYELAVNVPNSGLVPNLPRWAIVEVPALVDGAGVHGLPVGPLPEPIAAMCRTQVAIMDRAVEAGVHGDRGAALQALLLDPVVSSAKQADAVLAELLATQRKLLPQFQAS